MGYSIDLKKKLIAYLSKGHTMRETKKMFGVSLDTVNRWVHTLNRYIKQLKTKFFGKQLEFRVRLFNILVCIGFISSLIGTVTGFLTDGGIFNLLLNLTLNIFSIFILWYSSSSHNYNRSYLFTTVFVFFIIFPLHFIDSEGYNGGMLAFFILATVFTMSMFDGKRAIVITIAELFLYTSLCVFAYRYPDKTQHFVKEADRLVDIVANFLMASSMLCITLALYFRLYNKQQREIEAARKQSEEYAKIKGDIFAGMSHEMRTPLTIMSAYAQFAVEQLRESGPNEQTLDDLSTISDEAKRLAEMADTTLKVLMTSVETERTNMQMLRPVDMCALVKRLSQIIKPVLLRSGRNIKTHISEDIPKIYGSVDELTQLIWNILQNAITHAKEIIELELAAAGDGVKITVTNDGAAIEPALLPHIFERGISGRYGGSGIGLSICRDIAHRHNGDISAQNRENNGTYVEVTLKSATGGFDDGR